MIVRTTIFVMLLAAPTSVYADVVRLAVKSRTEPLAGRSFGATGPYEKLSGRIYFAVDPRNGVNQIITDVDKAPEDAEGMSSSRPTSI
jgi:hypothetical protein